MATDTLFGPMNDRELLVWAATEIRHLRSDLAALQHSVDNDITHMDKRLTKLEEWRWTMLGIAMGITALGGILGGFLSRLLGA